MMVWTELGLGVWHECLSRLIEVVTCMILMEERRSYPLKLPVDQRMKGPACCLALTCPRLIQGVAFGFCGSSFKGLPLHIGSGA